MPLTDARVFLFSIKAYTIAPPVRVRYWSVKQKIRSLRMDEFKF